MKIKKEIISKIEREYFFIVGDIDIDTDYFINKIEEGVKNSSLNYKTNVVGQMTDWTFFKNDKKFIEIILKFVDHIEEGKTVKRGYSLLNAWGVKESCGDYNGDHCHLPCYMSGSLYLNDHPQKLYFPEIKEEVEAKKGRFVLFSSFLKHYTKRNIIDESKYALAFNFQHNTITDQI